MTFAIQALIRTANFDLARGACPTEGHDWVSDGGRACPKDLTDNCSQAVYLCRTCGAYDYGGEGGPGADDCARVCQEDSRAP